jgi:hypothetical protein
MPAVVLPSNLAVEPRSASNELLNRTIHAANNLVAGKGASAGLYSARVALLIKGVMRSMVVSKLKLATAAVAAIALAVIGIEKFVFTAPSRPAVPVKEPRGFPKTTWSSS